MNKQNGRTHKQVTELLSAYMDGQVTADERALVETHLATCSACAHDLATLSQTVTLLNQLNRVAAPRPFTLRESDVGPMRPARPAWWRLPWAQGLVAAAAVLVCVVIVGGVLLLGRPGMVGAPAAPESLALRAPAPTEATAEEVVVQKTVEVEAEKVVKEQEEVEQAIEAPVPPSAAEEAAPEAGMVQEVPAEEPAPLEGGKAADEAEMSLTAAPARSAAAPAAAPTPTLAPTPGAMTVTPTPTLLEVEDLALRIEPGVIRVRGRLHLPEGRQMLAELWRDGRPIEWATPESQQATVGANGQFSLELKAQPDVPDFNLFGIEPAHYEIRIRPVDPPAPVEARIPFDTYGPPSPESTSSP